MVQIHGTIEPLKKVLSACPEELKIQAFHDIKATLQEQKKVLTKEKKSFKKELPKRVKKEENSLQHFEFEKGIIEDSWDERLNLLTNTIQEKKTKIKKDHRYQLLFSLPAHYSNSFIMKYIQKPCEVKKNQRKVQEQKQLVELLKHDPETVFKTEQNKLIGVINSLDQLIKSPMYSQCIDELEVLNQLGKLNDTFHVYCDLHLSLDKFISYQGEKNVGSASIDILVIGPTGIFIIMVNNPEPNSNAAQKDYSNFEQIDRASTVLYAYLKRRCFSLNPGITKVMVTSQNSLEGSPLFKSTVNCRLSNLNKLILANNHNISPAQIQEIRSILS